MNHLPPSAPMQVGEIPLPAVAQGLPDPPKLLAPSTGSALAERCKEIFNLEMSSEPVVVVAELKPVQPPFVGVPERAPGLGVTRELNPNLGVAHELALGVALAPAPDFGTVSEPALVPPVPTASSTAVSIDPATVPPFSKPEEKVALSSPLSHLTESTQKLEDLKGLAQQPAATTLQLENREESAKTSDDPKASAQKLHEPKTEPGDTKSQIESTLTPTTSLVPPTVPSSLYSRPIPEMFRRGFAGRKGLNLPSTSEQAAPTTPVPEAPEALEAPVATPTTATPATSLLTAGGEGEQSEKAKECLVIWKKQRVLCELQKRQRMKRMEEAKKRKRKRETGRSTSRSRKQRKTRSPSSSSSSSSSDSSESRSPTPQKVKKSKHESRRKDDHDKKKKNKKKHEKAKRSPTPDSSEQEEDVEPHDVEGPELESNDLQQMDFSEHNGTIADAPKSEVLTEQQTTKTEASDDILEQKPEGSLTEGNMECCEQIVAEAFVTESKVLVEQQKTGVVVMNGLNDSLEQKPTMDEMMDCSEQDVAEIVVSKAETLVEQQIPKPEVMTNDGSDKSQEQQPRISSELELTQSSDQKPTTEEKPTALIDQTVDDDGPEDAKKSSEIVESVIPKKRRGRKSKNAALAESLAGNNEQLVTITSDRPRRAAFTRARSNVAGITSRYQRQQSSPWNSPGCSISGSSGQLVQMEINFSSEESEADELDTPTLMLATPDMKPRPLVQKDSIFEQIRFELSKDAFRYYFGCLMEYAHPLLTMSHNPKKEMEWFIEDCVARNDPKFMICDIPLCARFPDEGNYRFCREYLMNLTCGTVPEKPDRARPNGSVTPRKPPQLSLSGDLYLDLNTPARAVISKAKRWCVHNQNSVYKSGRVIPPVPDRRLITLEQEFYKSYGYKGMNQMTGQDKNRIPAPRLVVKTKNEVYSADFERILNSASITNVSGVLEALEIDTSLFDVKLITASHPKLKIDGLHQYPQPIDLNRFCDKYHYNFNKKWTNAQYGHPCQLEQYSKYWFSQQELAIESYKRIAAASDKVTELNLIREEQMRVIHKDTGCPKEIAIDMYYTKFGTNVDLAKEDRFKRQLAELDKLPPMLKPNREENLLSLVEDKVLGVNTVQMYIKVPGSRTCAHMENALMASININLGPGVCVWFGVPYEYWGELCQIISENGAKMHDLNYWPKEDELLARGIPVIKFEQKAGDLVYVNTGCFHWVQAEGFCTNVSWNVGQPTFTQMATSMVSYSHNIESKNQCHVPLVTLAWRIAREKRFLSDPDLMKLIRSILIRSLAHNQMYLDVIHAAGRDVLNGTDNRNVRFNARCTVCLCEMYNIQRWLSPVQHYDPNDPPRNPAKKNAPIDYSVVGTNTWIIVCGRCSTSAEHTYNRTESLTMKQTIKDLCMTLDAYKEEPNRNS